MIATEGYQGETGPNSGQLTEELGVLDEGFRLSKRSHSGVGPKSAPAIRRTLIRLKKDTLMMTIHRSTKSTLALTTVLLLGAPAIIAQTCGGSCCRSRATAAPGVPGAHAGHAVAGSPNAAPIPAKLEGTAKIGFASYLTIQAALADGSLEKVGASAESLAKAIRGDGGKTFPTDIADQADRLAGAKDLGAVRKAFQPLSHSLVRQVKAGKVPPGTIVEVYCPMAKANWLQADKIVRNPYFGRTMLDCGQVKT